MTKNEKIFVTEVAINYYSEGFSDWMNGLDEPKPNQGDSYYTGFNEAKRMYPHR